MMNGIVLFFRFIKSHFGKILLTVLLTVIFLFALFPFSDLNDLISTQVSKLTQNKIFLQFDHMILNPFNASISFEKVFVEAPQISTLTTDELSLTPSLTALIASKPGGTIRARGFLKGDLEVHLVPAPHEADSGGKAKSDKYKIEAHAENLNLKDLKELLTLSLPITGKLNFNTQAIADISFAEQPEGEITITVNRFELPPSSIFTQASGRWNLPEIKLGQIELKGKLSNGKFVIETGKIGTNKDEFYGDIKGDLGLTFQNFDGQIVPQVGAYDISLEMKASNAFREKAKFFLSYLDRYKKDMANGTQYKFKIQASGAGAPPQFTPLQ
jgi:type II secretion system protein N